MNKRAIESIRNRMARTRMVDLAEFYRQHKPDNRNMTVHPRIMELARKWPAEAQSCGIVSEPGPFVGRMRFNEFTLVRAP